MPESEVPILVPEGKRAAELTIGELDIASHNLKADVLSCLTQDPPEKFYGALIEVAVLWAKRGGSSENAEQLRKRFRDYTPDDMFHALRFTAAAAGAPDPSGSSGDSSESSSLESSDDSPTS